MVEPTGVRTRDAMAFKDKEKPTEGRSSNIIAAKGNTTYFCFWNEY